MPDIVHLGLAETLELCEMAAVSAGATEEVARSLARVRCQGRS